MLTIIDRDSQGRELQRFELDFEAGSSSIAALLRARVIADIARLDRDRPESHLTLVHALRSRERDGEIELFTAPLVDVEVQVHAALDALRTGNLECELDGTRMTPDSSVVELGDASVLEFCRLGMIVGG